MNPYQQSTQPFEDAARDLIIFALLKNRGAMKHIFLNSKRLENQGNSKSGKGNLFYSRFLTQTWCAYMYVKQK